MRNFAPGPHSSRSGAGFKRGILLEKGGTMGQKEHPP